MLTNQHWVVIDDITFNKKVYIFRPNNDLLISNNGKVEKAKWEYLGNNSLLIDKNDESYLFKHGFFDENVLALRVDSKNEYAFLINENKYDGDINSVEKVIDFLTKKYLEPKIIQSIKDTTGIDLKTTQESELGSLISRGDIEIEVQLNYNMYYIKPGQRVFLKGIKAPNGKYNIGFMENVHVVNGLISKVTMF